MNTKKQAITQFELSKLTLRSLNKFKLSPTGKLVLMAIVDFYPNIYPAQQTLADTLGIGLSSVKRALKELRGQMLLIAKPDTKHSSLNYKFTSNFFGVIKLTPVSVQNGTSDSVKMDYKETKEKTIKKDFSFNSNKPKGIDYPDANILKFERDEKTPLTDKATGIKFIKDLAEFQNNPVIRKQIDKVIQIHNLSLDLCPDLASLSLERIKHTN